MLVKIFFQTLPNNLILYITRLTLQRNKCIDHHPYELTINEKICLLKLSHVCKSWRETALSILYHTYQIATNSQTRSVLSTCTDKAYYGYIRQLVIHINNQDLASNNGLTTLENIIYKDKRFPHVHTIKIHISDTNTTKLLHYSSNLAQEIATRIRLIAPLARNIHIKHSEYPVARSKSYWDMMDSFTSKLNDKLQTFSLDIGTHFYTFQNNFFGDKTLTTLRISWCKCSSNGFRLLNLYSSTLQELEIYNIDTPDISHMIVDESACPITYPYLLKLTLNGQSNTELVDRAVFEDVVPFPRLTDLNINIVYPFGDDVLFRGNANTLEKFCFNFDSKAVAMVNRANVFLSGRYKKLKTVKDSSFIEDINHNDKQIKQHMLLLRSIAPTIQYLHICDIDISQHFISKLPKTRLFKNIHTLNLGELHLALPDVIQILNALPKLQHLESGLVKASIKANGLDYQSVNRICGKYNNINKLFSRWSISKDSIICMASSALYSVILSRICHKFNCIQLPCKYENKYLELVRQFTDKGSTLL